MERRFDVALDYSPFDHYQPSSAVVGLEQTVFSHETRVSSPDPAAALGWVAGVWYSDSRISEHSVAESVTEVPPTARAEDTDTSTTPRFGLTYQSDRYGLLYATVARGHRNGGVYAPHLGCGEAPAPYPADSLWSYEVGSKSSLLDRRLDLDTSVFHIEWSKLNRINACCEDPLFTASTFRPRTVGISANWRF